MTTDLCHSVAQSRSFMPCSSHDNAERDGVQGVRDSVGQSVGGVKREDRERTRLAEKKGDEGAVIASEKTPCRGDTKDRYDNKNDANGIKALANGIRLHMNDIEQVRDGKEGRNVADLDEQDAEDPKFRDDGKNGGQELSEEEQRMGEDAQINSEGRYKLLPGVPSQKVVAHTQPPQQLQQGSVVRWERFLPQRQLRVLLVEDDDSTRHVVSALLRNCSYEVTSAANGLQAWELLEDPTNHVDLVLTEVVMPCLSGIGLLCKIMASEGCKHIPVIMMSSHDSMGIVFKCLSKGAVDFLVKPVRKNELKNLWQHVWRRSHSSSGSGSGSGSQTQKVPLPKSRVGYDNHMGSNDESDNASSGLNLRDGSDNGSGTQSSWTKRAVEVESPQERNDWELIRPHSGPRMEIPRELRLEKLNRDWVQGGAVAIESYARRDFDHAMGQDLEIGTPRPASAELKYLKEYKEPPDSACAVEENAPSTSSGEGEYMDEEGADMSIGGFRKISTKVIDLIGAIACKDDKEEQGDKRNTIDNGTHSSPHSKDKTISDSNSPPLLDLTLKRPRPTGEVDGEGEDRRVIRHSGSSAFSRYNTSSNHALLPSSGTFPINVYPMTSGYAGHSFVQGGGILSSNPAVVRIAMPVEKAGPAKGSGEVPSPLSIHPHLSPRRNNQDIGPPVVGKIGQDGCQGPMAIKEESLPLSPIHGPVMPMPTPLPAPGILYDGVPAGYGPLHPMFYSHPATPQWGSSSPHVAEKEEACDHPSFQDHCQSHPRQPQAHHHSHHYNHHHHHHHIQHHHHHHHQRQAQQSTLTPQQDEQTVTNVGTGAPRCGSSNMANAPEGKNGQSGSSNGYGSNGHGNGNGNGSLNGSATGSNNASNGHNGHSNGQSAVAVATGGNVDSGTHNRNAVGGAGNVLNTGNVGTVTAAMGPGHNRFAQREAALNKFRQKRKERCFEKKVRYQSRKRLAEQRPRVRGQFVRQSVYESTAGDPEHCTRAFQN